MNQRSGVSPIKPGQLLGKTSLERLIEDHAPLPDESASSVYICPGERQQFLESAGVDGRAWLERLSHLDRLVLRSDTGLIGLRAGCQALVILPPFPVSQSTLSATWDAAPLLALLEPKYTVGVVLLRLGRFSVAVYRGQSLLTSKTDARYVKGRHHAGGTSQKRFERVREGQVHRLYGKTCQAVKSQFDSIQGPLDFVLLGGDKFTLDGFLKECSYLNQLRGKVLERRLNVRDPKRDTLEKVGGMLSESRVYPLEW